MTLEQAKRLKEMGFPQEGIQNYYQEISGNCIGKIISVDPTAEEALDWVKSKFDFTSMDISIGVYKNHYSVLITNENLIGNWGRPTLSDAVYALIVWAYENKLLEA